jgi:hypothetical protein
MASEKRLTEAACKAAKRKGNLYYLSDGAGLRLRIRPDGSKTWVLRYRLSGKEMSTGLGTYPKVSLQVARAKAHEAKEHISKGDNPSTAKRIAKANQVIKGETTFGAIAREWLEHNKEAWSKHHVERNEGLLKRFLLPDLERMPIDSIKEAYLFSILKVPYDKGTKESARRARAIAAQVFSYARATHRGTQPEKWQITNTSKNLRSNTLLPCPKIKLAP